MGVRASVESLDTGVSQLPRAVLTEPAVPCSGDAACYVSFSDGKATSLESQQACLGTCVLISKRNKPALPNTVKARLLPAQQQQIPGDTEEAHSKVESLVRHRAT